MTNLVNYYNKPATKTPTEEINWQQWDSSIQTGGVVDTIRENYDSLMAESYNVDAVANDITSAPSDEYTAIVII